MSSRNYSQQNPKRVIRRFYLYELQQTKIYKKMLLEEILKKKKEICQNIPAGTASGIKNAPNPNWCEN